jgi:hypothetical protein
MAHYNRGEDVLEIKVTDSTGRGIEKYKVPTSDKALCSRIFKHLFKKYGINMKKEIEADDSDNLFNDHDETNWFSMDNNFFK